MFTGKPSSVPDHPDYVPSVFDFTPAHNRRTSGSAVHRFERLSRRNLLFTEKEDQGLVADALLSLGSDVPSHKDAGLSPFFKINSLSDNIKQRTLFLVLV